MAAYFRDKLPYAGLLHRKGRWSTTKEGGETLEQVAQRGSRCPIPGNIQGQVGQGSEQTWSSWRCPCSAVGLGYMAFRGPFQPKLFYDSAKAFSVRGHSGHPQLEMVQWWNPVPAAANSKRLGCNRTRPRLWTPHMPSIHQMSESMLKWIYAKNG